jgi:hypothetical protein
MCSYPMGKRYALPCLPDVPAVCHKSDPSTLFIGEDHSYEDRKQEK